LFVFYGVHEIATLGFFGYFSFAEKESDDLAAAIPAKGYCHASHIHAHRRRFFTAFRMTKGQKPKSHPKIRMAFYYLES
jgi:hypothetical protein